MSQSGPVMRKKSTKRWMVDSGSRFHLIDPKDVDDPERMLPTSTRTTITSIRLRTANGKTGTDQELPMFVDSLAMPMDVLLLPHCPPVLGLGELCDRMGFDFHWKSGMKPFLVHPSHRDHRIYLDVIDGVPYLPEESLARVLSARSPREAMEDTQYSHFKAAVRSRRLRRADRHNLKRKPFVREATPSEAETALPSSSDEWLSLIHI